MIQTHRHTSCYFHIQVIALTATLSLSRTTYLLSFRVILRLWNMGEFDNMRKRMHTGKEMFTSVCQTFSLSVSLSVYQVPCLCLNFYQIVHNTDSIYLQLYS